MKLYETRRRADIFAYEYVVSCISFGIFENIKNKNVHEALFVELSNTVTAASLI